jgi:hypothetical protein
MATERNSLRVAVVFGPGNLVRPVWFELNLRKHEVRETTYRWESCLGNAVLLHYAVSDGEALYELVYNLVSQSWCIGSQEETSSP